MKVSIYRTAKDNKGYQKEFDVSDIIAAIKNPLLYQQSTVEYRRLLNDPNSDKKILREFKEKKFKGVTWSGTFSHRETKSLIKHTGLICLDIDHVAEDSLSDLRLKLIKDPFCYIIFISPSGKGLKAVIKTDCDNGEDHKKKYFPMLQEYFDNSHGVELDKSGCNVDRLCFLPYDPEIYVNEEAETVTLVAKAEPELEDEIWETKKPTGTQSIIARNNDNTQDTISQVKYCAEQLKQKGIDITVGYSNWLKIGMALASLGEEGREHFHTVSSVNSEYDQEESDYKFSNFLKTGSSTVNIASFFYAAKEAGVIYADRAPSLPTISKDSITENRKSDWKEIYSFIHGKNRAGEEMNDTDVRFLARHYLVPPEKIEEIYKKVYEKYKDQWNLNSKPDIYLVEGWLKANYEFLRNEITGKAECRSIAMGQDNDGVFQRINKDTIFRHLQRDGLKFAMDKLTSLLKSDFVPTVNPFTEYFYGLPSQYPDIASGADKFDYINHLAGFITMTDQGGQDFWVEMFKKALVRSIACGIGGRENRIVMVFVQEDQNTGKSSFIRFLNPFGTKYYTEAPLRDGKDTEFRFAENFTYNIEELATSNAIGINNLKAIISKAMVKERKPFAEDEVEMPRRCNFWASTNKPEFLTDNQNTRWLCFKVKSVNHNYRHLDTGKTEVDINKVWAQAYTLYASGYNYQLSLDEAKKRDETNKEYEQSSTEKELVIVQFEVATADKGEFKSLTDIEELINKRTDFKYKINRLALGRAMVQLGFLPDRKYFGGQQVRGYYVKLIDFTKGTTYEGETGPPF